MKKETLLGLFIAVIMISSMFGIFLNQNSNISKIRYNNHVFYLENGLLYTDINNTKIYFKNSPNFFNTSIVSSKFINDLQNTNNIYFIINKSDLELTNMINIEQELAGTLFSTNKLYLDLKDISENITCTNATINKPILIIKKGNFSTEYTNYCFKVSLNEYVEMIDLRDALLYQYYGIK